MLSPLLVTALGLAAATPGRPLTAGEIALLAPVFGDELDVLRVRVRRDRLPLQPADTYVTVGDAIHAPGALWRDDYAARGVDRRRRGMFVHEATHVWQHQRGVDVAAAALALLVETRGDYRRAYRYRLDGRGFDAYGIEQQASIVEDWFVAGRRGCSPALSASGAGGAARSGAARRDRCAARRR